MQGVVKKWGNSAAVRIPAAVLVAARLGLDQPVEIREEGGRVIIEPMQVPPVDLVNLLAAITPENTHEEVGTGAPQGGEFW